ncbi:aspartate 1-decarboxylase [Paenibacillus donghaensis]|nr:aspartate 1-decarboxylase [Paenibacillus donghaensis]
MNLLGKIHRATVTGANLNYVGNIISLLTLYDFMSL